MKRSIVIVVVIGIIIGLGVLFYLRYTRAPKYSLWQAKKAAEQHDLSSFKKYVDIEGLCNNLIDQALEVERENEEPQNEWENLGRSLGEGLVALLKPRIAEILEEQVAAYIETGTLEIDQSADSDDPQVSISGLFTRAGGEKSSFRGIAFVRKEGKISYVGLKFFHAVYDTMLVLTLKMRNVGSYWQIAEISGFAAYVRELDSLETRRIEELNRPITEAMNNALILEKLQKSTYCDRWGIDKKTVFTLVLRNIGEKEIDEYRLVLHCSKDGKDLKKLSIVDTDDIMVGKSGGGTWTTEVNMFISSDNVLYDTYQSALDIDVEFKYIKFKDGSELKLFDKGQGI